MNSIMNTIGSSGAPPPWRQWFDTRTGRLQPARVPRTASTCCLGAPGCGLFVQPVALDLLLPGSGGAASGSVDASLQIPANAALVGLALRTQVVGIELNAASAITSLTSSNALDLVIGAF